jgi:hypothetical protein
MSSRGYRSYFESWTPTLNESADDSVDLTEVFKSNVLDTRVEAALPVIKRLSVGLSESSLTSSLEEWAGQIERDAVYGVEDKLDEGCDCGPDCDCPDCEEHNKSEKDVSEATNPEDFIKQVTKPNPALLGNERKPVNVNLSASQWELYSSMPESKQAARELNNAFNEMYEKGASKEQIRSAVYKVMNKNAKYGAIDTEPRHHLAELLEKYFPEDDMFAEGGYGEDPRGGRYGKLGKAKAVPVKPSTPAPATPTSQAKTPPQETDKKKVDEGIIDPMLTLRRLSGI